MIEQLLYLGITHKTATIDVRERAYPDNHQTERLQSTLANHTAGCFILQTCGRFEIYLDPGNNNHDAIRRIIADILPAYATSKQHWQVKAGPDVATHLIRVAAGLESQIVGEPQVLGQLKKTYTQALQSRTLGPTLSTLIRHAIHAGKRIRHNMTVTNKPHTLANLVSDHLTQHAGPINDQHILIVGCGNLAQNIAVTIANHRPKQLTITNRHLDRATSLANKTNAVATTTDRLTNQLASTDVAIVCTAAHHHIITPRTIPTQGTNPLHIIDLAVPRNVDPSIAAIPGLNLTHLDQLPAGPTIRHQHRTDIDNIITQTLDRLHQWSTSRRVARTINQWLTDADHPDPTIRRQRRRLLHKPIMMLKKGIAA